jgi:hypothetical protein
MHSIEKDLPEQQHTALACFLSILLTTILSVIVWLLKHIDQTPNQSILPAHYALLELHTSDLQRYSYLLLVLTISVVSGLVLQRNNRTFYKVLAPCMKWPTIALLCTVAMTTNWFSISTKFPVWLEYTFALQMLATAWVASRVYASRIYTRIRTLSKFMAWYMRNAPTIDLATLAMLVFFLWILPFSFDLPITDLTELSWIDSHYSYTVLGGYEIYQNGIMGRTFYGMGMPILTMLQLKIASLVSSDYINLVDSVKAYQLIALLLFFSILYRTNKKLWVRYGLFTVAISAWTFSNIGTAIGYPNQSGIRFIPLIAALLASHFAINRFQLSRLVVTIGCIAGVSIWLNVETGLAFMAGICAMIFFSARNESHTVIHSLLLSTSVISIALIISLILFYGLTTNLVADTTSIMDFLLLFGVSGYGGYNNSLSISAVFMLAGSLFVLFFNCLKIGHGKRLESSDLWSIQIAVTLVIWLYYYMNRMLEWNLWFCWLLGILLFASSSQSLPFKVGLTNVGNLFRRRLGHAYTIIALIFFAVLTGQLVFATYFLGQQIAKYSDSAKDDVRCVSIQPGFIVSESDSKSIFQFQSGVKHYPAKTTLVLSELPTLTRLWGYNIEQPFRSPFDAITKNDLNGIRRKLFHSPPEFIIWPTLKSGLLDVRGPAFEMQIDTVMNGFNHADIEQVYQLNVVRCSTKSFNWK